jgi:DNA repair protein RecO (recombination protein O)
MQAVDQQPAYVLHERPYRETSLLIEALTRDHGRVGLVARGVRREKPRWPRGTIAPLRPMLLSWSGKGELGNLVGVDPVGVATPFAGEALMSALYVNELLVRLLPRNDPHPEVFAGYAQCLAELSSGVAVAWTLRRFERDLLAELGYALQLEYDGDRGEAIDDDADYSYDPERGPIPWAARPIVPGVKGRSLRALSNDAEPDEFTLRQLRHLMRGVLRHHLGGRDLNAWRSFAPVGG